MRLDVMRDCRLISLEVSTNRTGSSSRSFFDRLLLLNWRLSLRTSLFLLLRRLHICEKINLLSWRLVILIQGFLGRYFASVHSLYATDSTVGESYFDASRVVPRRQHILNNALDLTAGGLICFEDDGDCCARHYLAGIWDWHAGLIEDFFLNLFFSPLFKTMIEEDVDDNIANMSCEEDS
ncbi:hypothetical protein KCU98_g137, partial [Aureobasidium melanogenum]